jgi:hypothetical protein
MLDFDFNWYGRRHTVVDFLSAALLLAGLRLACDDDMDIKYSMPLLGVGAQISRFLYFIQALIKQKRLLSIARAEIRRR